MDKKAIEFTIPDTFRQFGYDIEVEYRDDLTGMQGQTGSCSTPQCKIYLQRSSPNLKLSQDYINTTFLHEFLHNALNLIGYEEASDDERFVEQLSNLLYQMLKTGKVESPDDIG